MNSNKKFFSKIGFNYLAFAITAILFQIIIMNILAMTKPEILSNINMLNIISAICNYILPIPIFIYLMKKLESHTLNKTKSTPKQIICYICITMTLMWIGNIIGLMITSILSGAINNDIGNPVSELINNTNIWLNLLLISIIGPVFEEIFFRKILIDRTIKYGAKVSIILSGILFAFFHGNLNQFFYALLIGGFFAYVYIKTGKITYTIGLHIMVNLLGSVVSLIIAQSANILTAGNINPIDLSIVLIYSIIIIICFIIGVYELTKFNKAKFNGEKTEINLKQPLRTILLNYGMICFLIFFIIEIIQQTLS